MSLERKDGVIIAYNKIRKKIMDDTKEIENAATRQILLARSHFSPTSILIQFI